MLKILEYEEAEQDYKGEKNLGYSLPSAIKLFSIEFKLKKISTKYFSHNGDN
jgi:hypothetical protein